MWIDIKFLPFLIVSHIMQLHLCNINMLLCIFLISQTKSCISAVTAQSIFRSCVDSKSRSRFFLQRRRKKKGGSSPRKCSQGSQGRGNHGDDEGGGDDDGHDGGGEDQGGGGDQVGAGDRVVAHHTW